MVVMKNEGKEWHKNYRMAKKKNIKTFPTVGIVNRPNPPSHTVALRLSHPLPEAEKQRLLGV
jgi:hypothetical protein